MSTMISWCILDVTVACSCFPERYIAIQRSQTIVYNVFKHSKKGCVKISQLFCPKKQHTLRCVFLHTLRCVLSKGVTNIGPFCNTIWCHITHLKVRYRNYIDVLLKNVCYTTHFDMLSYRCRCV